MNIYFYFDIKKSNSKNRHKCRTQITQFTKAILDKKTNQISKYTTSFDTYIPRNLMLPNPKTENKMFTYTNEYIFKIVALKDLHEIKMVRFYCEFNKRNDYDNGSMYSIIQELSQYNMLYIDLFEKYIGAPNGFLVGEKFSEDAWVFNGCPGFIVKIAKPTMNRESLINIHLCNEEDIYNDENIIVDKDPLPLVDLSSNAGC